MLETNEMKVLRKIKIDRIRSQQIKEPCSIQPINEKMERRRREWDLHVTRMDAERLVKISKDNIPVGRCPGSPARRCRDLIIFETSGTTPTKKMKKKKTFLMNYLYSNSSRVQEKY